MKNVYVCLSYCSLAMTTHHDLILYTMCQGQPSHPTPLNLMGAAILRVERPHHSKDEAELHLQSEVIFLPNLPGAAAKSKTIDIKQPSIFLPLFVLPQIKDFSHPDPTCMGPLLLNSEISPTQSYSLPASSRLPQAVPRV